MRIFASGDWHDSPEFHAQVRPAVDYIVGKVEEERPDLFLIPGDLFVKRGHLNPLEMRYVRSVVERIAAVCPVVIEPGNHDEVHSGHEVDSISGVFCTDKGSVLPNVHVVTRPEIITVDTELTQVQILCVPFPSRQLWMPGKNLTAEEAHRMLTEMVGSTIRAKAAALDPTLPSVFMFHGSIEHGEAGPEVFMTAEHEVVVRQGDLPQEATVCLGGHLHLSQAVGRFLYTGAPCSHTFSTEKLSPSFLEVGLYLPVNGFDSYRKWADPNQGHEIKSHWGARYRRRPIPVAIPLFTLDVRSEDLGSDPNRSIKVLIGENADKLRGARVRFRCSVPVAQKSIVDTKQIEKLVRGAGAESVRVLVETRPEIIVRSSAIHSGISIEDGLNLWLDTQPQLADDKEALLSVATEVEGKLTPEQKREMEPVDVRSLRLGWSNFKQYGENNEIDMGDLKGLVAVVGANMAGKSNFAEIPAFVRWGATRATLNGGKGRLRDAVRTGEKECRAWEELESGGERYRIERTVAITNKAQKGTLVLSRWDGSQWVSMSGGDARETQRRVNGIVGSMDQYLSTGFSSQFDLTRILDMGNKDFQAVLQAACNTGVWAIRDEAAKVLADETRSELDQTRGKIGVLERAVSAIEDDEATVRHVKQQVETDRAGVVAAEEAVAAVDVLIQARERLLKQREEEARKIREEERRYNAARDVLEKARLSESAAGKREQRAENAVEEVQKALAGLDSWKAKAAELDRIEAEIKVLLEKRSQRDALIREANELGAKIQQLRIEYATDLGEWQSRKAAANQRLTHSRSEVALEKRSWADKIKSASEALDRAKKRAGLLGEVGDCVPPALRDLFPGKPTLNESCPLLRDAIAARGAIADLEAAVAAASAPPQELTLKQEEVERDEAAVAALEAERPLDPGQDPKIAEMQTQVASILDQSGRLYSDTAFADLTGQEARIRDEKPREEVARLEEARRTSGERQRELEEARSALTEARESRESAEASLASLGASVEALRGGQVEVPPDPAPRKAEAETYLKQRRAALEASLAALGSAEAKLAASQASKAELEAARAAGGSLERRISMIEVVRQACSRRGIPYLILEKALPLFESAANKYLEGTELVIQVVSEGDDAIERGFQDDAGLHPISEASGFAKAMLGLSMRWALCEVAASFSGTRVRQFVQDEGFGSFDQTNLVLAQRMLRRMVQSGVETMLVISHVPAVVEAADTVLTVVRTPKGSIIKERLYDV